MTQSLTMQLLVMSNKLFSILFSFVIIILVFLLIVNCQKPKITKGGINLKQISRINQNSRNNNNNNNVNTKNQKSGFLYVKNGKLFLKNRMVFLSGVNLLFNTLGQDFGNGNYNGVKSMFESYLKEISDAGGNAVKVMLFGSGNMSPQLDSGGYATGADTSSLIQEMGQFLDAAKRNNIFVIINLWSGSNNYSSINAQNLFKDENKQMSYINKVLKPFVNGLKSKKALSIYDIVGDPQGSVASNIVDNNKCYDTQNLFHQYATWTNNNFTMRQMQSFINRNAAAIKSIDPKALVTVTTKEEEGSRFCDWCYDYWQNKCLISAGGKNKGVLEVVSFDALAFGGDDYYWSPLRKKAGDYKLGKPVMIGIASANCSLNPDALTNVKWAFNNGYVGILNWRYMFGATGFCNDAPAVIDASLNYLKNKNTVKITI